MELELNATDEFYFQWHITERCNKHCSYCYQNGHPSRDLPLADDLTPESKPSINVRLENKKGGYCIGQKSIEARTNHQQAPRG